MDYKWKPRSRNYELERRRLAVELEDSTTDHPLQTVIATLVETKTSKSSKETKKPETIIDPLAGGVVDDPLSVTSDPLSLVLLDPLSRAAAEKTSAKKEVKAVMETDVTFEPWSSKRTTILGSYTTSDRIPITTSFLSSDERAKLETRAQAASGDKVKARLEQLDDMEDGSVKETLNLSQNEYVKKIDNLNKTLDNAWDKDQRVKALKIAIQCSKLLVDTSVIQFYPSKFVLITDILDNFGFLVYDRIRRKSMITPSGALKPVMLPEDFTSDQVPESGKETCRNWFFKIASIRELIPRFYVEAAILKCYSYLTDQEYTQALIRLTNMIRGIGDPLVACYARAYLCRVGMSLAPEIKTHLLPNFTDYLATLSQMNSDKVQDILAIQSLDLPRYHLLFVPGVEWILQCIAHKASDSILQKALESIKDGAVISLVVNAVLNNFRPEYISSRALMFADMIRDCEEIGMPKYKLYVSLGHCVVSADPPQDDKKTLLNNVWKIVSKITNPAEYIACTQIWIEFVAKTFTKREVNFLLDDVIKHMTPERAFERHYPELVSVVNRVVGHMKDFAVLFAMDKFLPFIDLFQKESVKVEVCKTVINAFVVNQSGNISDPMVMNAVMYLCKTLHDSLNALSLADERKQSSQLICGFIEKISFGQDFEQQLSFFVETRATFCNLDYVLIYLIHRVNFLAMETRRLVKGNHTRKTAAFVRACAAYTFITIPSLEDVLQKLSLYLLCGRVAVANGALSQGDSFFKSAIGSLKEVPQIMELDHKRQSTEPIITSYLSNFVATLLVIPDNPDNEVLYLIRRFLNGIQEYPWSEKSDFKMKVYMNTTSLLSAACQDRYLYTVVKVDSNDNLYAGDPKFVGEVSLLINTVLSLLLEHMKTLSASEEYRKRLALLSLGLFARLVVHADLSDGSGILPLLVNLWTQAQRHKILDKKLLEGIHRSVSCRSDQQFKNLVPQLTAV
ncbi:VPS35 endosomal protein-sorting factor-like [Halichondria panicea]|uniref:VPS35 endosomal protein-sorting factor-like n=1 Tax=Halichondria panicea TaxID=6063 RepID=UPI00312BABAF